MTYRDLFAVREYRALFTTGLLSVVGDQIAVVALAVLVYQRTGSPLLAALSYSLAYLPWVFGGPLLATLADRLPRRQVLVTCDVGRFLLIGAAAVPGVPLVLMFGCVTVAAFLGTPFDAARSALLTNVVTGERYTLANAVDGVVDQAGVFFGLATGGALVALLSPSGALAIDAATFAFSAAILRCRLRERPVSHVDDDDDVNLGLGSGAARTARLILGDRRIRGMMLAAWVGCAFAVVPEALAPAYVDELGLGPSAVGLLMAACAAGTAAGNVVVARWVSAPRRMALLWPSACISALPLIAVALRPGLAMSLTLFALVGAASVYMLPARVALMDFLPDDARGAGYGVAMTGLAVAQAGAMIAAGAVAQYVSATSVVTLSGVLGLLLLVALWALHRSPQSPDGDRTIALPTARAASEPISV